MGGLTGKMSDDVPLAMERAGLESYDEVNMMWHHFQDTMIRMLVSRNVQSVRNGSVVVVPWSMGGVSLCMGAKNRAE